MDMLRTQMPSSKKNSNVDTIFEKLFQLGRIQSAYEKEIAGSGVMGIDRLASAAFELHKEAHFDVILRKCPERTYRFSPYVEVLKSKGRNSLPRVISIPTIRDRIVLFLLKELLHESFDDCVNRTLPNTRVKAITDFFQQKDASKLSCVKLDIKSFYDSIDHDVLLHILQERIDSKTVLKLIRSAIESPTVPTGYRKAPSGRRRNSKGVPQGLAISNILADIYLHGFDNKAKKEAMLFHRYVDDVFSIVSLEASKQFKENLGAELKSLHLDLNEDKCETAPGNETFEYLGYRFSLPTVSVRQPTIDRFINSVAARFTAYRKGSSTFLREHPNVTAETRREVFIEDLNEKITGALSETRRYGWVFFFLQINDVQLLHKLDSIVRSFFSRLDDFGKSPPPSLKSLAKTFYQARYSPRSGYIHDYSKYTTVQEKIDFLNRRGLLGKEGTYKLIDVERIFETVKRQRLNNLEIDVGTIS